MRVLPAFALLATLLNATAFAQAPANESKAQAETRRQVEQAPKRGFLWEATRGSQRIVLMGTLHVGRADFFPPSLDVVQRLHEAAVIGVEADVFNAQKIGSIVQRLAFYPDGDAGLGSRLTDEQKRRVQAILTRHGMDPVRAWRMKPWMLGNTLVLMEAARAGYSPAYATEAFLFGFAQSSGKPIAELESIEMQLRLFDSAPAEMQLAHLEQVLKSIESGESEREVGKLVDTWARGDAAGMEMLLAKMRSATAAADRFVLDQIIDGRHPAMVAAIEKMADSGKLHFVAVGSLHFFGPNGLVELLRKRGFTVRRL